jgi:hypothetical protein
MTVVAKLGFKRRSSETLVSTPTGFGIILYDISIIADIAICEPQIAPFRVGDI